jgi:hypothetical protein
LKIFLFRGTIVPAKKSRLLPLNWSYRHTRSHGIRKLKFLIALQKKMKNEENERLEIYFQNGQNGSCCISKKFEKSCWIWVCQRRDR